MFWKSLAILKKCKVAFEDAVFFHSLEKGGVAAKIYQSGEACAVEW